MTMLFDEGRSFEERVLAEQQHDLPRFYAAVRALAKLPREERRARLCRPEAEPLR